MKKTLQILFVLSILIPVGFASAATMEELQAMIVKLMAQIQILQTQITQQQGTVISAPVSIPISNLNSTFSYVWNSDLYYGLTNNKDVEALQNTLTAEGCYSGPITGNFYGLTKAGVICFQKKHNFTNIPGTGYVGSYTRQVLNSLYSNIVDISQIPISIVTTPTSNNFQNSILVLTQEPISIDLKIDSSNGPINAAWNTTHILSWVVTGNPSSCIAGGNWSGLKNVNGGSEVITIPSNISGSLSYYLTCSGVTSNSPLININISATSISTSTCGDKTCSQYQACISGKCVLQNTPYKLGLVYIYNTPNTYNSNWKVEMEKAINKTINALTAVSDGKISASIKILGEAQTNIFSWNPAVVGMKVQPSNSERSGDSVYFAMPNSSFSNAGQGSMNYYRILENYCDNCIFKDNNEIFALNSENSLSYHNLWETNKLNELNTEISQKLGINFQDYDGVFIVFGKLGIVKYDPQDERSLDYRCRTLGGTMGGYSNLIMAENVIEADGEIIPCHKLYSGRVDTQDRYEIVGWHKMVHEILHRFGAVDVYDTGTVFGYDVSGNKKTALELDPKTNESIMGNDELICKSEKGGYVNPENICTTEQLQGVYLDKYNRQLMGLE